MRFLHHFETYFKTTLELPIIKANQTLKKKKKKNHTMQTSKNKKNMT
jgi:hypothetical protein